MLYIISVIIEFIGGILKGKHTQILGLMGFAVLAFLAANVDPTTTTDYANYQAGYLSAPLGVPSVFERGYTQLGIQAYNLGLTYAEFRAIFTYIAFLILVVAIMRFTSNVAMVASLFGMMLFFNLTTQIRNLMMIAIVLLGLSFLKSKTLMGIFLFIALDIVGAQIHTSSYFFLLIVPLVLVPRDWLKRLVIVVAFVTVLMGLLILIVGNHRFINLLTSMLSFVDRGNLVQRLTNSYSRGSRISVQLLIILTGAGSAWIATTIANQYQVTLVESKTQQKLSVLATASLVSLLAIPLIFLAPDYSRIPRETMVFLILIVAIYFEKRTQFPTATKTLIFYFMLLVPIFIYTHLTIWGTLFTDSIPYLAHWEFW
ncbi:EpsG family protein [Leuconostoc pseudomesenteroides]|uniref:EpsG family protein n=1 Tax=Leuconostoc pseudomesenteroides TaxID=33968 RepID=UPI00345ED149